MEVREEPSSGFKGGGGGSAAVREAVSFSSSHQKPENGNHVQDSLPSSRPSRGAWTRTVASKLSSLQPVSCLQQFHSCCGATKLSSQQSCTLFLPVLRPCAWQACKFVCDIPLSFWQLPARACTLSACNAYHCNILRAFILLMQSLKGFQRF